MDAILNWIWQGCVVAVATTIVLALIERSRAHDRYLTVWLALLAVLALPLMAVLWDASVGAVEAPNPLETSSISLPIAWWTSSTTVLALWALWFAIGSMRVLRAACTLRRIKHAAVRLPVSREARFTHWASVTTDGRRTPLVVSPAVRTAAVLGFGAPVIAFEPSLLDTLTDDELDRIVVHEWAHVYRHDDRAQMIECAIMLVAGWHPAVWWLMRQLRIEREIACDEMVVSVTGSAKRYASSLVKLASLRAASPTLIPELTAIGATGLRRRIARILASRVGQSRLAWRWAAAVGGVTLCMVAALIGGIRVIEAGVGMDATPAVAAGEPVAIGWSERTRVNREPSMLMSVPERPQLESPPARSIQTTGPSASSDARPATPRVIESITSAPALPDAHLNSSHVAGVFSARAPQALSAGATSTEAAPIVPWRAAADTGTAIGRQSRDAAVATAGYFSRLGKRIGSSF